MTLADPGFGQVGGGPEIYVFRDFADIAKQSRMSKASQYWPALAFLTVKYAFSHFSWYFFFKLFNVHLWINYKISISI